MSVQKLVTDRIVGSLEAVTSLRDRVDAIVEIADVVIACLKSGGTVYTAGNGGSAAEAMHFAEELIGRYRSNRRPLRGVCLNADPTVLTCIANDFGYDAVFSRQCDALVSPQDVLVAFSTSGDSANLIEAIRIVRDKGAQAIGLLGGDGGECAAHCSHDLIIPSSDTAHVQEAHQVVLHILCEMIERAFAGNP